MDRGGQPLTGKAKGGIPRDQGLLAGQDKPSPAIRAGLLNGCAEQGTGEPPATVRRVGVDPEYHLPPAGFVVPGGILIHPVLKIRTVGAEAVHKAGERGFFSTDSIRKQKQEPEMVGVGGQAGRQCLLCGGLRRGKAG